MRDPGYSLTAALLLLCGSVAADFVDECEPPPAKYVELKFEYVLPNETARVEVVEGLSPSGTSVPDQPLTAAVVIPDREMTGCEVDSYGRVPAGHTWVALVERGLCPFAVKEFVASALGARGLIVYQYEDMETHVMTGTSGNITATMILNSDGSRYRRLISEHKTSIYVTLSKPNAEPSKEAAVGSGSNTILLAMTCVMSPAAVLLNLIALIALLSYPEKPKPYLYLIGNLVLTDLFVAVIGTSSIALMYEADGSSKEKTEYSVVYKPCIASVLTDLWDLAIYSNLLTLLSLTAEHFIAFRWPLKHKIVVTKQRVMIVIGVSWLISCLPLFYYLITDRLDQKVPQCYSDKGFCYRLYQLSKGVRFSWVHSLIWCVFVIIVFVSMTVVYGYIIWIINRVSARNPGFRKKKSAVITTLFLIVSFVVSYIFYFVQHFYIMSRQDHEGLLDGVTGLFTKICPSCHLVLDFLFTGMIGSIVDPLIYCARMKEIKLALNRLFRGSRFVRRPSITSTGYIKAAPHSEEEHL